MINFVNLTPHSIKIVDGADQICLILPPSGNVARVDSKSVSRGSINSIPISSVIFGDVVGLPDASDDTMFIVSGMVRSAVPHRQDVASPGDLVRDSAGNVIGCRGLLV